MAVYMDEVWKTISGYEEYEISTLGRVKSHKKHRGTYERYLKPRVVKDGYLMVALYRNNKCTNKQVHRLVAEAFLEKPLNTTEINHIDGNKTNNCVNNLEWITHLDNVKHYVNVLKARKTNV
ncbi:MAG: NUMOD4 motif-containing HNH endonuclease [Methanobrevibacter sp.]|nr:NUMOD4 motif-containing HNH endonuclease [Methanobrevibacter sp.]